MRKPRLRTRNATILIVGVLLGLYLAVLIAFAWLGQERLRESLAAQDQLHSEKLAFGLGYFLSDLQATLDDVARTGSISTFFANRDLGMSMRYGLRASLLSIERDLQHLIQRKRAHDRPVFRRVIFAEPNGRVLISVGPQDGDSRPATYNLVDTALTDQPRIIWEGGHARLRFSSAVMLKNRSVGFMLADVDVVDTVQPFLLVHDSADQPHHAVLIDDNDRLVAVSSGHALHGALRKPVRRDSDAIETTVPGSPLKLVQRSSATLNHGILTSPYFLSALALVTIPLLFGLIHLWRLNNHNIVLRTRFQANAKQRKSLRHQNERLQREIEKRVESEHKLVYQANYDQLTGLPNRNLAMDRLEQALKWAKREDGSVLVLFLDLDRFKQVNDSLGHVAGDELLREAAHRLQSKVREHDTVSRLGGDEFLVICPEASSRDDWEHCPQNLVKVLAAPFFVGDHEFFVGASIGVAAYPDGGDEPQKLLKNADIAMYAAKESGRNRYCLYDPTMDTLTTEAVKLERNLRHALERNEFRLLYQPIVDLSSSRTVAVEALLRWSNPELGEVSPETFIPIAEETGLIHEIGEWVLHQACETVSTMGQDTQFRLAVNLSSKQFSRPARLLDCVLAALRESGMMPNQLELEITESVLIDDHRQIADLINQLDRIGVRLSIDDFGTGYSALNYLQRFPFDVLKIDRSFTMQAPDSAADASLIRAIIAMAHALDLEVVAEGIETRGQAGFLLVYHCEFGQGFLYNKPLTPRQLQLHLNEDAAISA